MKGVFASVPLVLTLSTVPAIAAPKNWMTQSPWKLKTPVITEFNIARDYYKRTVFLGSAQSLTAYVNHWGLKVQIYGENKTRRCSQTLGSGQLWAVCSQTVLDPTYYNKVVCVATNTQGRSLDPNIYREDYRTNVFNTVMNNPYGESY